MNAFFSGRSIAHSATRCHDSFAESEVVQSPADQRQHFLLPCGRFEIEFGSRIGLAGMLLYSASNGWRKCGNMCPSLAGFRIREMRFPMLRFAARCCIGLLPNPVWISDVVRHRD